MAQIRADQDIGIGAGGIGAPDDLAAVLVQGCQPAAHAELAAAVADQHLAAHHEGRHGHGLAEVYVAELVVPDLLRYRVTNTLNLPKELCADRTRTLDLPVPGGGTAVRA
jgi:hypothetical protein